ncbi:MAG: IS66 family insertion sequence element accessory protein TnpB [Lachnospiraceae bacterium]
MLYKRLESGRYQWPRNKDEVRLLSRQQLRWLLEGLTIEQPKAIGSIKNRSF